MKSLFIFLRVIGFLLITRIVQLTNTSKFLVLWNYIGKVMKSLLYLSDKRDHIQYVKARYRLLFNLMTYIFIM